MSVLAIVGSTDFPDRPALYEQVLINFASQAHVYGWEILRTSHARYDVLEKKFSQLWRWDGSSYVPTDIQPTHIYFLFNVFHYQLIAIVSHYPASTNLMLCSIAKDKYATYKLFSDYSPFTATLSALHKDSSIIDNFSASKLVMKPMYGAQGVGVSLVEKDAIYDLSRRETMQSYSDYVIQDFVDFSGGIPGIVDGIHDVRLVVFGKKVVYVLIRVPHESDFRCNISQGGDYFFIDFTDLPMNMQQDALTIIDRLNLFTGGEKYAYSVDIALGVDGKTYLIEFNSAIGLKHLVPASSSAYVDRYLQGIFSLFETD